MVTRSQLSVILSSLALFLSGAVLVSALAIRLEVFLPHDGVLDEMIANRPSERAVYFLRNKGESDSTDHYRLVNDYQAVFRELAGRVHAPVAAEGEWVAELEGRNFEEMIEELSKVRP